MTYGKFYDIIIALYFHRVTIKIMSTYYEIIEELKRRKLLTVEKDDDEFTELAGVATIRNPQLTGGALTLNQASRQMCDLIGAGYDEPEKALTKEMFISDGFDIILAAIYLKRPMDKALMLEVLSIFRIGVTTEEWENLL